MTTVLAIGLLLSRPQVQEGTATYMNPGLIEADSVALNDCTDKGREVYVHWLKQNTVTGPHWVSDCAQRGVHCARREAQGRIVEVSAQMARRMGFYGVGPVPVRIAFRLQDLVPVGVPGWN